MDWFIAVLLPFIDRKKATPFFGSLNRWDDHSINQKQLFLRNVMRHNATCKVIKYQKGMSWCKFKNKYDNANYKLHITTFYYKIASKNTYCLVYSSFIQSYLMIIKIPWRQQA